MQDTVEEATNFVADAARLKAIKELLKHSPTGAAAVQLVELRNIKVVFSGNTGTESYWDGHRIVIARHQDLGDAALTLVHEAQHAVSSRPDPRAVSRDEFVRKMLENEVQSRVAEARTARELDSAVSDGRLQGFSFTRSDYDIAYNTAGSGAAGEEAMMKLLVTHTLGTGESSKAGETYADYFERRWRELQPKPNPVNPQPENLTGVM